MAKARILIVEDEYIVARNIQKKLNDLGYTVCGAVSSGGKAIQAAEEKRPDLVLMDIRLKGETDGIETANRIYSRFGIPFIYLTALSEQEVLDRAKITGPFGYLIKPFEDRELQANIEMALYKANMEAKLKESEERFRTIADFAYDWELWLGPEGNFIYTSPSCERITGYRSEEFLADPELFMKITHPDDHSLLMDHLRSDLRGVDEIDLEYRIINKGGEVRWISHCCQSVFSPDGTWKGRRGSNRDITQRKWAEEELIATRARLEHLIVTSPPVIFSCKATGDYGATFVSRNIEEVIGYRSQEFLNDRLFWVKHIHPEDTQRVISGLSRIFKRGHHVQEYRFQHKNGLYRWIYDQRKLVRDSEGKPLEIVGYWIDITEKRKMEEELLTNKKLETVGVLAGGIAHDFNNLLCTILGNIEMARLELYPGSSPFRFLNEAEKSCLLAKNLIQRFITFSTGGTPVKETVATKDLVEDVAHLALSGSNIRSRFLLPDDLWPIQVDEGQVSQALHNIIENAKQAMPEGGIVTISAENIELIPEDEKRTLSLQTGRYVKISVKDHGAGIPEENLGKIFDPYFSTKERGSQKGMGLGLAITYSIIKKHHGAIRVESDPGSGTTVYVYLPASQESPVRQKTENGMLSVEKGKILAMDDDEAMGSMVKSMLERLGYQVELAIHGEEAIQLYTRAQESGKPFDAVILDLTVRGGMGGQETLMRLREINPEVKAIVSSGHAANPVMANFREYGFSGVIPKPYLLGQLGKTLNDVLLL